MNHSWRINRALLLLHSTLNPNSFEREEGVEGTPGKKQIRSIRSSAANGKYWESVTAAAWVADLVMGRSAGVVVSRSSAVSMPALQSSVTVRIARWKLKERYTTNIITILLTRLNVPCISGAIHCAKWNKNGDGWNLLQLLAINLNWVAQLNTYRCWDVLQKVLCINRPNGPPWMSRMPPGRGSLLL